MKKLLVIPLLWLAASLSAPAQQPVTTPIPARPEQLKFAPLDFKVPKPDAYSFKLKSGIPVWIAEDHTLPIVRVSVSIRAGEFLEPPAKTGLASLTGTMMRKGGAGDLTAEQFDERADFLAANLSSYSGGTESGASLNCLSSQLGPSLDLFFAMLKAPRFQADRLEIEKGQELEAMKQRNDDADDILAREWNWLLYGRDHFVSREPTKADLDELTRDDLIGFHAMWWRPENMIFTVSGDVGSKAILAEIEKRLAGWKPQGPKVSWPPAPPNHVLEPGLYHEEKDIPQGKVAIGHRAAQWDPKRESPDDYALIVMNDILGGGGFTARITKRIRSDEGLAYSAGSSFGIGDYWPGSFRVFFQTKNSTVAFAAKIALTEIRKIREAPVGEDELATAKNSFIETFPRNFESPSKIVGAFAADDYIGRPHAYWEKYRENIRKVTVADVQRVARQYLKPDQVVFLVVGKWSEIEPGDADGKAKMKEFFGGQVRHLPLRDPLTLEPLK